jgi:hypothetical protein
MHAIKRWMGSPELSERNQSELVTFTSLAWKGAKQRAELKSYPS